MFPNLENISEINSIFLFPCKVGGKSMWLDSRCGSVFVNGSPQVPLPGIGHGKAGAKPNEKGLMTRTRNKARYVQVPDE
jgi:hypothetical protein